MGLPSIVIEFVKKAVQAIQIGAGGVVGIILKDEKNTGALIIKGVDEIPTDFTKENQEYIQRAFWVLRKRLLYIPCLLRQKITMRQQSILQL